MSNVPTRVATPGELYGLAEQVSDSSAISILGLLHWAANSGDSQGVRSAPTRREASSIGGFARGVLNFGKVFLPS